MIVAEAVCWLTAKCKHVSMQVVPKLTCPTAITAQAQAEDLAAEDCLSVLEKGYAQGAMGTAEYLKQVG